MASGTPTLTTKLPGMPDDYYKYVFLFSDESPQKMSEDIKRIFCFSDEELHTKGREAKDWILKEKNNILQIKNVIDMLISLKKE